ncbi:hypothetical protein F8M41_001242 [Gigaspora margarita]|uniref:Uncharacterized protein n=1 Tax=Gigaspora margarita TaxID=4874 RepID=A0A8H4A963_GIGMA|nr:hypothetical protein F8M41_001242 [Gigaspora margarita]
MHRYSLIFIIFIILFATITSYASDIKDGDPMDPETIKAKLNSPFEDFSSKSQTLDLHASWSRSDIFFSGGFERSRVKYDWSKKIVSDITEDYYLWSVPLFYRDIVKDFTIFYIRIEKETVVNSGMYTAFE